MSPLLSNKPPSLLSPPSNGFEIDKPRGGLIEDLQYINTPRNRLTVPNTEHALLACVPVLSELYWTWLAYVTFWKGFLITINQTMYSRSHVRFGKKRQICLSVMNCNLDLNDFNVKTTSTIRWTSANSRDIVAQKSNRWLGSGKSQN